jgi:hypothetical protein
MAEGPPQIDAGALNHARGIGQGGGKIKTDDYVNEDNATGEHTKAGIDKAADAIKLSIPFLGKITLLFPGVGAQAGLENEGAAGKMIPSFLSDIAGGVLASLLKLIGKNRTVTDLTQNVGGGAPIEGTFSGGDFQAMAGSSSNYPNFPMMDYGPGFGATGNLSSPLPNDAPVISAPNRGSAAIE